MGQAALSLHSPLGLRSAQSDLLQTVLSAQQGWFRRQFDALVAGATAEGNTEFAAACARHLVLCRASLSDAPGQLACLQELHELRLAACGPPPANPSVYRHACVAVCLRLLSQECDPYHWRHHEVPGVLPMLESAFDRAVFALCERAPSLAADPAGRPQAGVGFERAGALFLAALQRYFGGVFGRCPAYRHDLIAQTLAQGLPVVLIGTDGPVAGDDTHHAWIFLRWQPEAGQVLVFEPSTGRTHWHGLAPFLGRLTDTATAFVRQST